MTIYNTNIKLLIWVINRCGMYCTVSSFLYVEVLVLSGNLSEYEKCSGYLGFHNVTY
jgi:hypothetical protein